MQLLRWSAQRPGERLLRLWLGATFTYAGVEKLADPGFFDKGSTTYIGSQLEGFSQGSPIGPILDLLGHAPVLAGVAVALTEILIGVATLAGVAPATAAFVGTALSVSLWLSASWHVHPYFLGSDSIYAVAWLAYALSLPSTTQAIAALRARTRPQVATDDTRRQALRGGAVVLGGLALGGGAALVGRARKSDDDVVASTPRTSASATTEPSIGASSSPSSTATGTVITSVSTLTADGGVDFDDPAVGDAVVCALADGSAAAFSRKCTHSGCTASYDRSSKLIVCPCHGSRFDPENGGAPTNGPATQPLQSVPVQVDGDDVRLA